jgi:hypothetical protein
VLLLRQKARPSEVELYVQHSRMVDEALEMISVQRPPGATMDSSIPSLQTNTQAEP